MNGCNNCSKRRGIRKECPWGGTYHHKGENGEHIGICNAYKQETNADRIRAMSDEELAELLDSFRSCAVCRRNGNNCFPSFKTEEWLRQPWEEET
jgi:hypothetical protein|nr:MAG TPA: hypothetical protein [Caudoviricetes sp.]